MKPVDSPQRSRKTIIIAGLVAIVLLVGIAFFPLARAFFAGGHGVKTEGIDTSKLHAASTDVDGTWEVTKKPGANESSAGFTFFEILPAERRVTSGSTRDVSGSVVIDGGTLTSGDIKVNVTTLTTDSDVRDNNVRTKILTTDTYPDATFTLTQPADVSGLPDDGTVAPVELTGDLTIRGQTRHVTEQFDAVRSGKDVIVAGTIPIKRSDYGVETPEFVAAKIADEGEVNIKVKLEKN